MSINWKQKLSSRKFWAALVGFLTAILAAFNVAELTIEQIVALVTGVGALAVYILGESIIDSAKASSELTAPGQQSGENSSHVVGLDVSDGSI